MADARTDGGKTPAPSRTPAEEAKARKKAKLARALKANMTRRKEAARAKAGGDGA